MQFLQNKSEAYKIKFSKMIEEIIMEQMQLHGVETNNENELTQNIQLRVQAIHHPTKPNEFWYILDLHSPSPKFLVGVDVVRGKILKPIKNGSIHNTKP